MRFGGMRKSWGEFHVALSGLGCVATFLTSVSGPRVRLVQDTVDHSSSFWWLLVEEYSYIRPRLGGDFLWSMNPQGSCRFMVQSLGASPCRLEPGGRAGPLSAPLPVFERLPSWTWLVSEENFNGDAGHGKSLLGVKVQRLDWSSPGREAESGVRA